MQDLFYEDDSVLFIDMHQHEVWPGSGHVNESGRGKGEGFTINVPLPGTHAHAAMTGSCLAACLCVVNKLKMTHNAGPTSNTCPQRSLP